MRSVELWYQRRVLYLRERRTQLKMHLWLRSAFCYAPKTLRLEATVGKRMAAIARRLRTIVSERCKHVRSCVPQHHTKYNKLVLHRNLGHLEGLHVHVLDTMHVLALGKRKQRFVG